MQHVLYFFFNRKELIQKLHNFVHLNLCIALALGLFLFLTGIQTATANVVSHWQNCMYKAHVSNWAQLINLHLCNNILNNIIVLFSFQRVPASLLQSYYTTSSWPPSPGHSVKQSSFTSFWWRCLEPMTKSGSTSIWHWDGVSIVFHTLLVWHMVLMVNLITFK